MLQHGLPIDAAPARSGAWYRQPVLWLGAAILVASLAGCVWMIVLGARHADTPVEGAHPHTLLDMPVHGAGNASPARAKATRATDAPAGRRP
jgi:hypothetical protein